MSSPRELGFEGWSGTHRLIQCPFPRSHPGPGSGLSNTAPPSPAQRTPARQTPLQSGVEQQAVKTHRIQQREGSCSGVQEAFLEEVPQELTAEYERGLAECAATEEGSCQGAMAKSGLQRGC